jgi:MauM/NapG family ferredoxin protein
VARDGITRRELLRGRARPEEPAASERPIVNPGQRLPDVISWLDPEMSATPHRGGVEAAFPLLRPPGAVAEPAFLEACTRCGDCRSACPHDAIREAPESLRTAGGTPIIDPIAAPCQMCDDLPCLAACETGALRPEAPAALGTARVQALDCLNRLSTTCSVCVERCPVPGALDFVGGVPEVNEPLCTGCGICQHVCPAPNNAILMLPNAERPTPAALDQVAVSEPAIEPEIELPDLHEAELDEPGLRALFRDLEAAARIDALKLKPAPGERAVSEDVTSAEALELLLEGRVRGVQVRYFYADQAWCDTVLASPAGYRVVRIAEPAMPTGLV